MTADSIVGTADNSPLTFHCWPKVAPDQHHFHMR